MPSRAASIYVQIDIRAPIDRVWKCTQTPHLHQQWDLRFTDIQYLPRPDPSQPQRFLYATRIGLGMRICGQGETVGTHDAPTGERTSALRFWSDDRKSLIREGSGYWKYIPSQGDEGRTRFLTGYDYSVRFGAAGCWFDRLVFRPLIGWATAWSFDRLRLWLEQGIPPRHSAQRALTHWIARGALAFIWAYQGIVPKLLFHHQDELSMLHEAGFSTSAARNACTVIGCLEAAMAMVLLIRWRWRWPLWLIIILMPLLVLAVGINSPRFIVASFNPVALNLGVMALAVVALLSADDLPSARHCVRRPPGGA